MNLQSQLATLRNKSRDLSATQRAMLCCDLAKEMERAGEYDVAREALIEFWPETTELQLDLDGLEEFAKGEVLLRIGALLGWLGSLDQRGGQELAKNLITQSIEVFERLELLVKASEARSDLALCYWREGSFDEARVTLARALAALTEGDVRLKATILIRAGIVEFGAGRLNEALRLYDQAAPLVEQSADHALEGSFHIEYGLAFRRLATPENREDYLDRALVEYSAASFHFEQAGNNRFLARVEANIGFLFFTIGKFSEAHQHLDRARYLFLELKETGTVAKVDETRARTFLAEGRFLDAERLIRSAVRTLERGDEQAILAEALITQGTALARLGRYRRARNTFNRAIDIAETVGDLEGAGRAKLSIIEELDHQTSHLELASTFQSAAELLRQSQDPTTGKRLITCARRVIAILTESSDKELPDKLEDSFSLKNEVRTKEKALIEKALRDSGGSVTKAAHILGFKHHQSLITLINGRHKDLLGVRSVVRRRRRHLFSQSKKKKGKARVPPRVASSQISILHVEDHKLVAQLVHDLLVAENWKVESCNDGDTALRKLTDDERYDVIVVDYELPGLSGLQLVKRARKMTHRRRTPIIMLSASDHETEAWRAGVDAFLHKPDQISDLPITISRLLRDRSNS